MASLALHLPAAKAVASLGSNVAAGSSIQSSTAPCHVSLSVHTKRASSPSPGQAIICSWQPCAGRPSISTVAAAAAAGSSCRVVCLAAVSEEAEEEVLLIQEDSMERMEKSLESVRSNFNTVRTGRATPSLLDRVEVEYYGTNVNLRSIAQISAPDASTLMVSPFDKSSIQMIEKALQTSDVGLTPNNDGTVIRLSVPQLTQERRKALLKTVSKLAEDGKVALRNVRRETLKSYEKLEKEKKISKDNLQDLSDEVQKMTDDYVKQIDTLFKSKEKELTTV